MSKPKVGRLIRASNGRSDTLSGSTFVAPRMGVPMLNTHSSVQL